VQKPLFIRLLTLLLCSACVSVPLLAETVDETDTGEVNTAELGYFFGYHFGKLLKEQGSVDVNMEELNRGIIDSISGKPSALKSERQKVLMAVIRKRQSVIQEQKVQADSKAARGYLAENMKKEGMKATASGLQYEVLTAGTGTSPQKTDEVVVHYRGSLVTGVEFDSSYDRDPAKFRLNQVIPGWTEGLQLMHKGAKYKFYIPPELGYGANGVPRAGIPPNAVLIFEVELLEIMQ